MADALFEDPRLAATYDAFEGQRPDLEAYLRIAEELNAQRVLDVGCGTGTFALLLAARGLEVIGLDPARALLELASGKPDADRVRWVQRSASAAPPLGVDLVTMTGNVAQAIVTAEEWDGALQAIHAALRPGGYFVFETRDPAYRGWEQWTRAASRRVLDLQGVGVVEKWVEVIDVALPLVSFRSTFVFHRDGEVLTSDSTLRFRERAELESQLSSHGYLLDWVRDAPDRPGREFVFLARRSEHWRFG
jgi:SAM-dependent methyltransferase